MLLFCTDLKQANWDDTGDLLTQKGLSKTDTPEYNFLIFKIFNNYCNCTIRFNQTFGLILL